MAKRKMPAGFAKYAFKPKAKSKGLISGLMGGNSRPSFLSKMEAQVPVGNSSPSKVKPSPGSKTIEVKGHTRNGVRVSGHRRKKS